MLNEPGNSLGQLSGRTRSAPSIHELLGEIMDEFGGAAGLAREIKLDFDANKPGHANRIRIESDLLRSLANLDEESEEEMDLEQMKATVKQLLEERDDGA